MSSTNNNDNGGFYTSDRRRGSDEATTSGISTSLFGGTNYTTSKPKSKSTNNSRASELSSIGSNPNKLLHHIEKRVSSGKSCNTSELLNLLEKKVNGSGSSDEQQRRLSSSKSCGGTSINATAQSNAQVRTSSSGSIRTSSGRVRRLLLEQDASMSSIATSTKPVFTNNNNVQQSLSYNHNIDDDYSRSYNSSLATHITAQTTTGSGLSRSRTHSNASTRSIMEEDESLASIEDNDGGSLNGNSFFSIGSSSLPSRISHITNTSTSTAGTTLSLVIATIIQSNCNNCKCQKLSSKQLLGILMATCLLLNTIYNITSSTSSLLLMRNTNIKEVEQQLVREERVFSMCNRLTPFQYAVNPTLPRYQSETQEILEPFGYGDKPIDKFNTNWGQPPLTTSPTSQQKKILLLRNDGKFGHIGNQFNSILHAFDYAKDYKTHIGIFGHSWFMDVIQSMFYETLPIYSDIEADEEEVGGSNGKFDKLDQELYQDFGIIVIRNQTQLQSYTEIIYKTAEELYFYHSSKENWRIDMYNHILILRQLYMRYNRGLGVIHNGLQSQNVCDMLNLFFEDGVAGAKYSVIHARYLDGNAVWRLERLASATGMTIEGGVMQMGPAYVKGILKPLNMLDHPIILITDGQLAAVERGLLNDEILGPKLMVLSNKEALDGADVVLAVLADVFIGNPASVTSGFIARSRMALGYSDKSTQLFRTLNPQEHRWSSVCNEECVFNPYVMERFV